MRTYQASSVSETPPPAAALRPARARQVVDPAVSRAKFQWDLAQFRESESTHRRQGVLLLRAEFPEVLVAFAHTGVLPSPVAFGALVDYTDYDLSPPSVSLVDPFTGQPLEARDLPADFLKRTVNVGGTPASSDVNRIPLLAMDERSRPVLRLPGTRAYHEHPAVGVRSWMRYRAGDAGSITSLVRQLFLVGFGAPPRSRNATDPLDSDPTPAAEADRPQR